MALKTNTFEKGSFLAKDQCRLQEPEEGLRSILYLGVIERILIYCVYNK